MCCLHLVLLLGFSYLLTLITTLIAKKKRQRHGNLQKVLTFDKNRPAFWNGRRLIRRIWRRAGCKDVYTFNLQNAATERSWFILIPLYYFGFRFGWRTDRPFRNGKCVTITNSFLKRVCRLFVKFWISLPLLYLCKTSYMYVFVIFFLLPTGDLQILRRQTEGRTDPEFYR